MHLYLFSAFIFIKWFFFFLHLCKSKHNLKEIAVHIEHKAAMNAYVESEQQSMEHYLEDQYQIAKNAKVETLPSGEVVLVCCEDSDTVLANLKKALAA